MESLLKERGIRDVFMGKVDNITDYISKVEEIRGSLVSKYLNTSIVEVPSTFNEFLMVSLFSYIEDKRVKEMLVEESFNLKRKDIPNVYSNLRVLLKKNGYNFRITFSVENYDEKGNHIQDKDEVLIVYFWFEEEKKIEDKGKEEN